MKSYPSLQHTIRTAFCALLLSGGIAAAQAPTPPCTAPASWFPSTQTPAFDPTTFPGSEATNCDFHQWAWQTFLWLTQEVNGEPRFMSFPTAADLFNPKSPTTKPKPMAALWGRPRQKMVLRVRSQKQQDASLDNADSVAQAGGGGILVDQNGNPLFYSVNFDPVFYNFVQSNGYYDYNKYSKAPPATNYPLGAMELKSSWRIVADGENTSNVYTTKAEVPKLQQDAKGNVSVVPGATRSVTVAFVGIHIVGIVANHPEFIWATFEHHNNAPDKSAVPSSQGYTFYAPNTPLAGCLLNAVSTNTLKLDSTTQTFTPITQVYRANVNGDSPTNPNPANSPNITSLNASVHSQLESGAFASNYDLVGGIWLFYDGKNPTITPAGFDDVNLRGSLLLANTTMETYHQNLHCFVCHNTSSPGLPDMNMNLSHILTDGLINRPTTKAKKKAKQ